MSTSPAEPRFPRRRALYESRREREFYRYYEPIRELTGTGPPLCDLHDPKAVEAHLPSSSPDRALTAFCQLGALRLQAKRAMLFFFDSSHAYILAEATRTLSLLDGSVHSIDDALWLGHSIIPRGFSVCEHTVNLPANLGSNRNDGSADIVHIIDDLTGDVRFCDRPYVKGGPMARFYAGVPITTPKGLNIGAYCIVDDRPRNGLDDKEVSFLRDMAATVMTHLEMVRHSADQRRNSRMVSGLSAFVDGASSVRRKHGTAEHRSRKGTVSASSTDKKITSQSQKPTAIVDMSESSTVRPEIPGVTSTPTDAKADPISPGFTSVKHSQSPSHEDTRPTESLIAETNTGEDLRKQRIPPNIKTTFERVAQVVQEAVEVDGAMFLDATVASYGRLIDGKQSSSERTSDSRSSGSDATHTENEESSHGAKPNEELEGEPCVILGSSVARGVEVESTGVVGSKRAGSLSEKFLHMLLRKYPSGKIWNFNEEGDASSEDDSSGSSSSQKTKGHRSHSPVYDGVVGKIARKRRRKRARIDDGREIQRLFPEVRSLALIGMWDPIKGKWFAGCMIWTYSSLRLLSAESELSFLTVLCDAAMAEVHRLEASNADNAKMDFISSISHELRSPLHGILGSVECLQEQLQDATNSGLISQVEVCARTLLDIVNHLLDFSKINDYARKQDRNMAENRNRTRVLDVTKSSSRVGGKMTLDADVSLDITTEEVVEAAFYSFCWSKEQQVILDRDVAFILDIDRSPEIDWRCRIATGGWKRICINLISNALKYTSQGYVHVTLKSVPLRHKKRFNAVLTVSDTGRGMSQDFLINHLFKAFSQEDSLVEGTGLGMSLVAKIVKALGGKVDVKSIKGVGTTITVTVPLQHSVEDPYLHPLEVIERLDNVSVGIVKPAVSGKEAPDLTPVERGQALLRASLERTCVDLGFHLRHLEITGQETTDVALILESDLALLQPSKDQAPSPFFLGNLARMPLIVLCNNAITERQIRNERPSYLSQAYIDFVPLPAGPNRLRKAIRSCLESISSATADLNEGASATVDAEVTSRPAKADPAFPTRLSSRVAQANRTHRRWLSDSIAYLPDEDAEAQQSFVERMERSNKDVRMKVIDLPIDHVSKVQAQDVDTNTVDSNLLRRIQDDVPQNLCLLLVDDNQINLQLLVTYADKRRHHRITATNGLEAVEAYKAAHMKLNIPRSDGTESVAATNAKPQVVLMDINMPVLDGFEATRQIRQFEKQAAVHPPATIIALTGLGSADAQHEAYGSGVDLFLTKPVRLKELTRILEGLRAS